MTLRKFTDGILASTLMSAAGAPAEGAGGGGGAPANAAFLAALPETLRGHESFKDVKDVGDLAARYHKDRTAPFAERLPEAIRGEAYFKDIKSEGDLATKAFNQAKLIGRDPNTVIALPADAKDDKAWGEIYNRLGRPESADKYVLPTKRADGRDYGAEDKAFQQSILPILHDVGLTQPQLAKLLPKWDGIMDAVTKGSVEAQNADYKTQSDVLRAELGATYDTQFGLAQDAIGHLSRELKLGDGLAQALDRAKLANSPELFKLFAHLGSQLKEDGLLGKAQGGHGGALSPAQARQEIAALEAEEPWRNKEHPQHGVAIARRSELFRMAYPEG